MLSCTFSRFKEALVELDQRACVAARIMDIRRYERTLREQELEKLKWESQHLEDMEEPSADDIGTEQVSF